MSETSGNSAIRYAHTNLVAEDWQRLMAFYVEVFACVPTGSERDYRGPHVENLTDIPGATLRGQHLRLPGHGEHGPTLEIFQFNQHAERPPTAANRPGFAHLAFEVPDVAATRAQVLARGGRDLGKLQTIDVPGAGKLTLIYLCDPEGNIIELQKWH